MLCADHISRAEADEAPAGSPTACSDCVQAGVKDCCCSRQDCIQCGLGPCNQCTPTASSDRGLWKHGLQTEAHMLRELAQCFTQPTFQRGVWACCCMPERFCTCVCGWVYACVRIDAKCQPCCWYSSRLWSAAEGNGRPWNAW